jgi:hypothetical protein
MPDYRVELISAAGRIWIALFEGGWEQDEANAHAINTAVCVTGDKTWRTILVALDQGPRQERPAAE